MRFLVIGATGYVGRNVVAEAVRLKHEVVAHVRPGSASADRAAADLVAGGARVVRTAWAPESWYRAFEADPPERVFLLLGTTAAKVKVALRAGEGDASQTAIDLGLTMMAVGIARVASPEAGLIYVSALGASAAGNEYLRVRATVEAALVGGPNPFTVVRPSFITGSDRAESRPVERVGALVGDALCAVLRAVGNRRRAAKFASITGPELARILVALAASSLDRRVHELDEFRS